MMDPSTSPLGFGLLESGEVLSQHKAWLLALGQHSHACTEIRVLHRGEARDILQALPLVLIICSRALFSLLAISFIPCILRDGAHYLLGFCYSTLP